MRYVVVVWLLLSVLSVQAQDLKKASAAQQKSMVEKINQTAATVRTMECEFTQVKKLSFLNDKMTSSGKMAFMAAGSKLRWEYVKPYTYTFILNGDKVYIRSAKNSQTIDVRQSRLFQGIAEVMMNSVTGKGLTTSQDFGCVMYSGPSQEEWVAVLTPKRKEMKKLFREIRLHFSSKKQVVTQVEMTEQSGDTTVITLKNVKTGGSIDEKMFAAQ